MRAPPTPGSWWPDAGHLPSGPPPGWYGDPWHAAPWRWWDGWQWTPHVWPPHHGWPAHSGWAPAHGSAPRRMRDAVAPSIGLMLAAVLGALVVALAAMVPFFVARASDDTIVTVAVIATYPALFGGFWLAARRVSSRYGTGDLRVDFGWQRVRRAHIGWGVLGGIGALVAQVLVALAVGGGDDSTYREALTGDDPGLLTLAVLAVAVVVGAPVFEELMFRGPIQRALIARTGVVAGLLLQALVFALYHVIANPALIGLWYLAPLFAAGLVFGVVAHRTGGLAAAQIAHAVMNAIAFAALVSTI